MKKYLWLLTAFLLTNAALSQNLNSYKYASIPLQFSFLKDEKPNKYNLSTLSKLFMEKYGFETYVVGDNTAPYDFVNNNCNKVYVDLQQTSNMFLTRLKVVLKDCNGKVLYTSREGVSNEKIYERAYNEALRGAFVSMAALQHKYDPNLTPKNQVAGALEQNTSVVQNTATVSTDILYAQPIQNGFQLVNSEPKVVYKIYKTSNSDIYAAVKGNISGVFIPKGNEWYFEYYQNDQLVSEKVNVKF